MARAVTNATQGDQHAAAWAVGLVDLLPDPLDDPDQLQDRGQAIADPPVFLFFDWTLENYAIVQERSDYMRFLWNSVIIAGGSTILGIIIAVPAAWSMAFVPSKRTKDILLWMLSTKMLPAVGVLYPIYLSLHLARPARHSHRPGDRDDADQPADHRLDALHLFPRDSGRDPGSRPDGRRRLKEEILYILTPMAVPGIASTMLLNFILAWNEAFWTLNLTAARRHRSRPSSPAIPARKACSTPSSPPPRPWRSRRSSSSAGSARSNWCAA
jgi:sorbitol/mannitol transport system permease protein